MRMIEVCGVRMPLEAGLAGGEGVVRGCVASAIGVGSDEFGTVEILRRNVDARKDGARFIATVAVECEREPSQLRCAKGVTVREHVPYEPIVIPRCELPEGIPRPVVVGTGPAGLFAGLYLARAGLRPLVLERGGDVDERTAAVEAFSAGADLDPVTNVQFGEGGAGTFSDGKLTTGTKSPLARPVLHWFVDAGAPDEILWQAKPHIGTDRLVGVVRELRRQIEEAGGEVRFHAKLEDVVLEDGKLREIIVKRTAKRADGASREEAGVERIPAERLVLACGHSARDTFRMLQRAELAMERKAFSVGVRIEHPQEAIDRAQYGVSTGHPALGAADYKLVAHLPSGRSVYTFCMCPGGEVVAAASEEYGVVVNGMSRFARDGANANAALLVGVGPEDFPGSDPLAGCVFQRHIEQAAYGEARDRGGAPWQAPAQTVGDFLADRAGGPSDAVHPSYSRGVVWCNLRDVMPEFVGDALAEALPLLGRKLRGFDDAGAVMTGVETRSSSPVRILRGDEDFQAWRQPRRKKVRPRDAARGHGLPPQPDVPRVPSGIYPCGEGCGYAGGIMSAAVDGLRVAQVLAEHLRSQADRPGRWAAGPGRPTAHHQDGGIMARDHALLEQAVEALKAGHAVVFPTDTVYGLGVAVNHAASPQEIYDLKQRDAGKPVAWLVGAPEDVRRYGRDVPEDAFELAKREWPGPLTLIIRASAAVPSAFRAADGTIALRMPASATALALIAEVGPLATSSANLSGRDATGRAEDLDPALIGRVACVLREGVADDCPASGTASAIIDFSSDTPRVVRRSPAPGN